MCSKVLRPYQQEDLSKLTKPAMCIFNEQRTGKTPTSIMTMEQRQVKHLLVVCPASLTYKWADEIKEWTNKDAIVLGSAKRLKDSGADTNVYAWIINYENIRGTASNTDTIKYILKYFKPDGLIVDEVHRCKDRSTLNFKAINYLNNIPNRLYLSGTPAPNKPYEVWSALHYCDPKRFSSFWNFIDDYFVTHTEMYYKVGKPVRVIDKIQDNKVNTFQQILNEYSIMRKRKDVMQWLPEEEAPTKIKLECTPAQKKYIKSLKDMFEIENKVECKGVLDSLIRMRQILAAPAILDLRGNSPKVDWLLQYIKDYPDKSIIIFSNSLKLLLVCYGVVLNMKVIAGNVSTVKRHEYVKEFQEGKIKILGIQTQAGKEGLTLDQADTTIFLDVYPPAADYMQAKDRMVATSEDRVKPKEIIHLIMKDSYDERLYALVEHNIEASAVVNDYISYLKEV